MQKQFSPLWWGKQAALLVVLVLLPFVVGHFLGNTWVRTLDFALLYVMLALGLNMVVGFAGLLDLGYVAFYAVGAYTYALLGSPQFGIHWPFYVTIPLGMLFAALFGILLGTPVLKLKGDYLAIVTLGFGEIIRIFMNNLNAPINITNGPQGISNIDPIHFLGLDFSKSINILGKNFPNTYLYYFFLLVMVGLVIVFVHRLQFSRIGRAWEAMREDDIAAQAMGINIRNMKLLAFSLGAMSGGLAGGLFSALQAYISPESFILTESIMILAMVVLGGMGNIKGVIFGALMLNFIPMILRDTVVPVQNSLFGHVYLPEANARMLVFGLALVLMMLIRPEGIFPNRRRKAELHHKVASEPAMAGEGND